MPEGKEAERRTHSGRTANRMNLSRFTTTFMHEHKSNKRIHGFEMYRFIVFNSIILYHCILGEEFLNRTQTVYVIRMPRVVCTFSP